MPNATTFFTVGPQQQPASLPALGFDERSLHPIAVEFESADASPVPALEHDPIAPEGQALVVAGMAFQASEYHNHPQEIQSGKKQDQPCTMERKSQGNRTNNQCKGIQNEKLDTRGEGVIAPGDERQFRRRPQTIAVHAKDPCRNPLRTAGKTQTHRFSRAEM
jgi:hypothetical protein